MQENEEMVRVEQGRNGPRIVIRIGGEESSMDVAAAKRLWDALTETLCQVDKLSVENAKIATEVIKLCDDIIAARARPTEAGTPSRRGTDPALETEVAWLLAREQGKEAPPLSPETAASYERLQGLLVEMANAPVEPSPGWQERVLSSICQDTSVQPVCAVHFGAVHGGEAEELRKGIEKILAQCDYPAVVDVKIQLISLLDDVDARDSLAHVEELDALKARVAELERELTQAKAERNPALALPPVSEEAQAVVDRIVDESRPKATLKRGLLSTPRRIDTQLLDAADDRDTMLAILRAIWPVWRLLLVAADSTANPLARACDGARLNAAIPKAIAALTPELLAVAKAAGLDTPKPSTPKPQKTDSELHAECAHPDFEYMTTRGPRKAFDEHPPPGDGWERNVEEGRGGWERFDYHEEAYWRRKVTL